MQLLMENPAVASCGAPKNDLAGASINSEFIASLFPIQANPVAERKFALDLAAFVFRHPIAPPRRPVGPDVELTPRYKALTANLNYSPELARWILKSESVPVTTVDGKRYAHRLSGIKLRAGPVSARLGGEYVYGVFLEEQEKRRALYRRTAACEAKAMARRPRALDFDDLAIRSLHSSGSAPTERRAR